MSYLQLKLLRILNKIVLFTTYIKPCTAQVYVLINIKCILFYVARVIHALHNTINATFYAFLFSVAYKMGALIKQ